MEEDDTVPPTGGIETPEGSKARGGSGTPEGTQTPGGGQPVPHIGVDDEDGAPREDSAPVGLQEGEKASEAEAEETPQSVAPEGPAEPIPTSGTGAGTPAEVSQVEAIPAPPATSAVEAGVRPPAPGAVGDSQGAPGSYRKSAPRAR
jgi:hypothetical protein